MSDPTGKPQDTGSTSSANTESSEPLAPWEVGRKNPPPPPPAPMHYAAGQAPPSQAPPPGYGAPPGSPPPYPAQGQPPYGGYPQQGQSGQPYAQQPYPQQPYGQAPYGQQPNSAAPYAQRPGAASAGVSERSALYKWLGPAIAVVLVIGFLCYEFIAPSVGPDKLSRFVSPDQRYSVMAPASWSKTIEALDTTSESKAAGAIWVDGPAKIDITTDSVIALKAQDLLTSNGPVPDSLTGDPLPVLHRQFTNRLKVMRDYNEQTAQTVQTDLGSALVSEFTGEGGEFGLGGPTHGYQASIIYGDTTFEVVAQCNEKSWSALSPMFMQVIKSMAPPDGKPITDDLDLDSGSQGSSTSAPQASGPPPIAPPAPDDFGTGSGNDDSGQ